MEGFLPIRNICFALLPLGSPTQPSLMNASPLLKGPFFRVNGKLTTQLLWLGSLVVPISVAVPIKGIPNISVYHEKTQSPDPASICPYKATDVEGKS